MSQYRARAVVLRTMRLGEADRIVNMVTDQRGKVRAVVKGVRRTKSRWGARLEPLSHVALLCWQGRELDVVTQAEVLDHFRPVRENLDRMSRAAVMLEAVDQVVQEGQSDRAVYTMLVGALRTLADGASALVAPAFLLKLLALEGSGPRLDACAECGQSVELVAFDPVAGGALCRGCRSGMPLTPEALDLMRRILGGGLGRALAEPPSAASAEVESLATRAMEIHIERRLRSAGLLA